MVILTNKVTGEKRELNTNFRGVDKYGNVIFRPDGSAPGSRFFQIYSELTWDGTRNENGCPLLKVRKEWTAEHVGRTHTRKPRTPKGGHIPPKKEHKEEKKEQPKKEYLFEDFDSVLQDLKDGYNVYMYGPAGAGKSYTAKKLAEKLGIPYYELNQLTMAHEVTGYGDAAGNYVGTPAYEAVVKGGLLFLDEFDRSAQQVTTVINTLLANRRFTFPVIGNVEAHPNFRCICAGNTAMRPDAQYTAACQIDASSRDRFIFYHIDYDRNVELNIQAKGDEEIVNFMEDMRRAIKETGIDLVCSPRSTEYMERRKADMVGALNRGLYKGLDPDEINNLWSTLQNKENPWAKATKTLINKLLK